mgnify:FL=1
MNEGALGGQVKASPRLIIRLGFGASEKQFCEGLTCAVNKPSARLATRVRCIWYVQDEPDPQNYWFCCHIHMRITSSAETRWKY